MADTIQAPISGLIIAGGHSKRLGQDKRRLRLWGRHGPTLLEHVALTLAKHCDEVIVVLNDAEAWTDLPARTAPDVFPDSGPLGGIYSGLAAASHPFVLAVASDMPFLSESLIQWMIDQPRDYDVLAPRVGGEAARNRLGAQSLHAIYSRACAEPMRRQLASGNPQVIGFFDQVKVQFVEANKIAELDPAGTAFLNVNTPAELDEARRLLAGRVQ